MSRSRSPDRAGDPPGHSARRSGLDLDEAFARAERRIITCNVICIWAATVAAALIARLS
jgi:hypothetical protein